MDEEERLRMVLAVKCVDNATISCDEDLSVCQTLEITRPDIFANGGDWKGYCREQDICSRLGIKLVYDVGGDKTQSSSKLIADAAQANNITLNLDALDARKS